MDTRDIKPISDLKTNTAEVIKELNENRRPLVITQNGRPKAVLQDPESYEESKRALHLLKLVAQGETDLLMERTKTQEDVFNQLELELDALNE